MAGIGVRLNRIYEKNTIVTNLIGFGYSTVVTIAPMILVVGAIFLMGKLLALDKVGYAQRELFSCTVLYIFIFALQVTAPFNAVISRYLSDVIYEEHYEDILPCFYMGMLLNVGLSSLVSIPFCVREYLTGNVPLSFVFMGYCGFMGLVLVFYAMLYLAICKDYRKISLFFFLGMLVTLCTALYCGKIRKWEVTDSMLFALVMGFVVIAGLEIATIRVYFKQNSGKYKRVLQYFRRLWKLALTNFIYIMGLYIHNFVFWNTELRTVVADSFVCAIPYDMATCLAMVTNITATVIFTTRVEMHFHGRYKAYSEAVIGGRLMDIKNAESRMFGQLRNELMNLVRVQFIISVVMYLFCMVIMPQYGFSGLTMKIYPSLAGGYFILFVMYAAMIFLFYFNDMTGALMTAVSFFAVTLAGSIFASGLPAIWYGMGLVAGAFAGWCVAYGRLRWVERNLDIHIFCNGHLMKPGRGEKPSAKVWERKKA